MQGLRDIVQFLGRTIRASGFFTRPSTRGGPTLRWAESCAEEASALDLSSLTDAQLRSELQAIEDLADDAQLARCLALAATAVNRRLGAWRIFETDARPEPFAEMHRIADRVTEYARFSDSIRYFTKVNFPDTAEFQEMLDEALDAQVVFGRHRPVVRGLIYQAETAKTTLPAQISLPGDFYHAVTEMDADDALAFRPSRQQIVSAALLTRGVIVEMDAGEGKTVSTGIAALALAATGSRVHVLTANDYLARRDAERLAPIYESLGVSVGEVVSPMDEDERRSSYSQTIVYSTVREIGFDYLRENLRTPSEGPVQSGFDTAIVDEADHVLVDQSRTPLIISDVAAEDTATFERTHRAVKEILDLQSREVVRTERGLRSGVVPDVESELAMLYAADPENATLKRLAGEQGRSRQSLLARLAEVEDTPFAGDFENRFYYRVDDQSTTVRFTDRGESNLDAALRPGDSGRRWAAHSQAHQFLRAYILFDADTDYVIEENSVVLVDPFTGRLLPDNRYMDGLQPALEAKEGLPPKPEGHTLAQITIPGLMARYGRVSGLTGTAVEAEEDFRRDFGMPTVRVPPTHPSARTDFPPTVVGDAEAQRSALLAQVINWRAIGRPVLIGTASVAQSELISSLLHAKGVRHQLLNAVNSDREAQIVRDAGRFGAVTVATNMAGRGTDILLEPGLNRRILNAASAVITSEPKTGYHIDCPTRAEASVLTAELRSLGGIGTVTQDDTVVRVAPVDPTSGPSNRFEFGLGLCVIGVALNAEARIDRQLRGRAGRQGAFGTTKMIVSAEDPPISFSRHARSLNRTRPGDTRRIAGLVHSIQSDSSADNRWQTAQSRGYASVIEAQTLAYYRWRRQITAAANWLHEGSELNNRWAENLTAEAFEPLAEVGYESVFDRMQISLWSEIGVDIERLYGLGETAMARGIGEMLSGLLSDRCERMGPERFDVASREAMLATAAQLWPEHLENLRDASLNCAIAGPTHQTAVCLFVDLSHRSFLAFLEEVGQRAAPRLLDLTAPDTVTCDSSIDIPLDDEILSVLA